MAATLYFRNARRTASEWSERVKRASAALAARGLGDGRKIGVLLPNCFEFLEAIRAIGGAGSVPVPVSIHFPQFDLARLLERESFDAIVTSEDIAASHGLDLPLILVGDGDDRFIGWERLCAGPLPTDGPMASAPEARFFTSGSTALPKTTVRQPLPPEIAETRNRRFLEAWRIDEGMRTAVTGPLYHQAPLFHAMAAIDRAERLVILDDFDAETLIQAIAKHRLTHLHLVPRMMRKLLELEPCARPTEATASIEFVIHGAAKCPRHVKERMIDWWGPVFREYYASSEFGMISSIDTPEWLLRPSSVGEPFLGVDLEIRDLETGDRLPPASFGVVFARADDMPTFAYIDDGEESSEPRKRGDFITVNDVGWLDDDGFLHLHGRRDGVAIISGINFSSESVRTALLRTGYVTDALVRVVPDEEQGQRFVASVVLAPGESKSVDDLVADLRPMRIGLAMPREIDIVEALPETETGKIIARYLPLRTSRALAQEEAVEPDSKPREAPPRFPDGLVVIEKDETGSTNSDAIAIAKSGPASPLLVWARRQTAGRGRNERRWVSPEGNIYWTLLLDITDEIHPRTGLVFVSSLAAWKTIRGVVPQNSVVQIKWPNDTLVDGEKVSGVLIETVHAAGRLWAAVGIGINVVSHPETGAMYPAADLAGKGASAGRNEILGSLTANFLECLKEWRDGGFANLRAPYLEAAYRRGQWISVSTGPVSKVVVSGNFHDVDEGGLLLEVDGEIIRVSAGDLLHSAD